MVKSRTLRSLQESKKAYNMGLSNSMQITFTHYAEVLIWIDLVHLAPPKILSSKMFYALIQLWFTKCYHSTAALHVWKYVAIQNAVCYPSLQYKENVSMFYHNSFKSLRCVLMLSKTILSVEWSIDTYFLKSKTLSFFPLESLFLGGWADAELEAPSSIRQEYSLQWLLHQLLPPHHNDHLPTSVT